MRKGLTLPLNEATRQWILANLASGSKNYWFTFLADSASALFFLGWELNSSHPHPTFAFLALALGYGTWTLTEYGFHRWLYHDPHGVLGDGHRLHHDQPLAPLAMPWFLTTLFVFTLWYVCALILRWPFFSAGLAGWLLGFVWYSLIHHSHHHWNFRNSWMRKLKAYHRVHHQLPGVNFGVTMRFWDTAFGTLHRPCKSRPMPLPELEPVGEEVSALSR
jgi:sterol desaturase/sphingolipid hydroxylase (fatty acid hydroxylase superfamily)